MSLILTIRRVSNGFIIDGEERYLNAVANYRAVQVARNPKQLTQLVEKWADTTSTKKENQDND